MARVTPCVGLFWGGGERTRGESKEPLLPGGGGDKARSLGYKLVRTFEWHTARYIVLRHLHLRRPVLVRCEVHCLLLSRGEWLVQESVAVVAHGSVSSDSRRADII